MLNFIIRYEKTIKLLLLLFGIILFLILASGCAVVKRTTETKVQIDTVYVNSVIDTIRIEKEYKIKKDSLIFDTIRAENNFSKIKIYPSAGKIKVEFLSKPFEIKIHAVKSEKIKSVEREKKISLITKAKYIFLGFAVGVILTAISLYNAFKNYKLTKI